MADRICVSTDYLRVLSSELTKLQLDLTGIEQRLTSIECSDASGGEVRFRYTCRLSDGSSFTGKNIHDAIQVLDKASHQLGVNCQKSATSILKAAERFDETEKRITEYFLRIDNSAEKDDRVLDAAASPLGVSRRPYGPFPVGQIIVDKIEKAAEIARIREARKREYLELLRSPDPASNPRIYEIIDERLMDCGYSLRERVLIIDRIQNAPADFKEMYIHFFYQYTITNGSLTGHSGAYNPANNTLYVDASKFSNDEDFLDTFFHETGHAIDANAGYISENDSLLFQKIKTDTENYINQKIDIYGDGLTAAQKDRILQAFMSGTAEEASINKFWGGAKGNPPEHLSRAEKKVYNKVVQASYADLRNSERENDCMPPDILTGMTNNAITSGGGHPKDYAGEYYWFNPDGTRTGHACREAWAEYYSSMMTRDAAAQRDNISYMPNTTNRMNEIARDTAQKYREACV